MLKSRLCEGGKFLRRNRSAHRQMDGATGQRRHIGLLIRERFWLRTISRRAICACWCSLSYSEVRGGRWVTRGTVAALVHQKLSTNTSSRRNPAQPWGSRFWTDCLPAPRAAEPNANWTALSQHEAEGVRRWEEGLWGVGERERRGGGMSGEVWTTEQKVRGSSNSPLLLKNN